MRQRFYRFLNLPGRALAWAHAHPEVHWTYRAAIINLAWEIGHGLTYGCYLCADEFQGSCPAPCARCSYVPGDQPYPGQLKDAYMVDPNAQPRWR